MAGIAHNNIEKLRGRENFHIWKRLAKSYLIIKDCWKVVEKEAKEGDKNLDQKALAEITMMIEPYNFAHIANAQNAKSAWDALEVAFADKGLTRQVELLKQLVNLKLDNCESMNDYVNQMVMLHTKIKNVGYGINEKFIASLMLAGLPSEFKSLVLAVENSGSELTIDSVKTLLLQDAKFDDKNKDSAFYTKNIKTFRCHACKQTGHFARNCPTKNNKSNTYMNKQRQAKFENKNKNKSELNILYASLLTKNCKINDWIIDSGASSHMTNDNRNLINERKVNQKEITVANNEKMVVISTGDMKLKMNQAGNYVLVKNVDYVPNLCANLLSVRQMTQQGNNVIFKGNKCLIYNIYNELIGLACSYNGLYKLICHNNLSDKKCSFLTTADDSMNIWHRRFGHSGSEKLKQLAKSYNDINFGNVNNANCDVCVKGKLNRLPFKETVNKSTKVLEIIHSDVMGPMNISSFSGARYLLTFVDDYSRKVFAIPIKAKSDVFNEFKIFKQNVENQCSSKIKILRSDNGREYINKNFETFLKQNGIKHQTTCPYTPEQNGMAERMNRTLTEKIRCMLIDSQIHEKFWAEAAVCSSYLINLMPTKNDMRSPEEIYSNKKPQ